MAQRQPDEMNLQNIEHHDEIESFEPSDFLVFSEDENSATKLHRQVAKPLHQRRTFSPSTVQLPTLSPAQPRAAIPSKQSRKRKSETSVKYAFKTRSESEVLEDGYKWRKYGKKLIKNSPHPRNYYKCSDINCSVKKRVERDAYDGGVVITTYEGNHNHQTPTTVYCIEKPSLFVSHQASFDQYPSLYYTA